MIVGYLAAFFLLVFLLALALSAFLLSRRERAERQQAPLSVSPTVHKPIPLPSAGRSPHALSDFERTVLKDVYGMSDDEIRFSEALLHFRDKGGRVYVTSNDRPDGFFQC